MDKCPRCNLPQNGIYKCQYCGYVLSNNKKRFKTIRNKLKDIIGTFNNKQTFANKKVKMTDHGGTRSGSDRRKYKYMHYPADRRRGKDRRKRIDRRGQIARRRP